MVFNPDDTAGEQANECAESNDKKIIKAPKGRHYWLFYNVPPSGFLFFFFIHFLNPRKRFSEGFIFVVMLA